MANFLLLNGANLNLLGTREPEIYGETTLESLIENLSRHAEKEGHKLHHFQSNAEHELVERIHRSQEENVKCIVFNPGAFTHSSISIRDALSGIQVPFIEIHISNIYNLIKSKTTQFKQLISKKKIFKLIIKLNLMKNKNTVPSAF